MGRGGRGATRPPQRNIMNPRSFGEKRPESIIQSKIMNKLRIHGWFCKTTHGNIWQCGFPDIFACNIRYGTRWIEIKQEKGFTFTEAQLHDFPILSNNGSPIWILTSDSDWEYNKLFGPANWYFFLNTMKVVTRQRAGKSKIYNPSTRLHSIGPERDIQEALKIELASEGWFVKETVGNIYQYGFADLYATHKRYGTRWIEVKNPKGYVFTPSQLITFPAMIAQGCGIWVLDGPGQLDRLFKPCNFRDYL
jgi:hypothetical protein